MKHYYVNKVAQSNGDNEVHTQDCTYLPNIINREYVGYFSNCKHAIRKAKENFPNADGCFHCSYSCHNS